MAVCVSAKTDQGKGDGSISKCGFQRFINAVGFLAGVAFTAASFFILCDTRNNLAAIRERVEGLEYDRLREAYKQAGYEVD